MENRTVFLPLSVLHHKDRVKIAYKILQALQVTVAVLCFGLLINSICQIPIFYISRTLNMRNDFRESEVVLYSLYARRDSTGSVSPNHQYMNRAPYCMICSSYHRFVGTNDQ